MSDEEVQDVGAEEVSSAPEVSQESEAPQQAEQASAPQQDVWSAFRTLPEFQGQEDQAIAQRLYESMRREEAASRALQQYQSIIPVASEYLSNRDMYERWKSAQEGGQQQPMQQQAQFQQPVRQEQPRDDWWNPPQIKDSYKRYLTRDESGREIIDPNAPLDARAALQDYMEYRANFAQKFLDNPQQALGPMVEKIAAERAQQIIDGKMRQMQDESLVTGIEQQNRDWLYDKNGNVSAEGLAVQKYIQDAKALGISGPQARWDYATRMVERDLLLANMQQLQTPQAVQPQQPVAQQPQPTVDQRNMEYLRQQAMRTSNQRQAATTDARTPSKPMTFEERLMANAQEAGLL